MERGGDRGGERKISRREETKNERGSFIKHSAGVILD